MILPIGDDNSDRASVPVINYLLIVINILVFIFLQGATGDNQFTASFATVPEEIRTGRDVSGPVRITVGTEEARINLGPTPNPVYITLLTSMFMHGGWMHLLGNMLFLWIFGDNVEDRLGHFRYLVFYLACGAGAALLEALTAPLSPLPLIGASGAIAGVLGAFFILYPWAWVTVLIP